MRQAYDYWQDQPGLYSELPAPPKQQQVAETTEWLLNHYHHLHRTQVQLQSALLDFCAISARCQKQLHCPAHLWICYSQIQRSPAALCLSGRRTHPALQEAAQPVTNSLQFGHLECQSQLLISGVKQKTGSPLFSWKMPFFWSGPILGVRK